MIFQTYWFRWLNFEITPNTRLRNTSEAAHFDNTVNRIYLASKNVFIQTFFLSDGWSPSYCLS